MTDPAEPRDDSDRPGRVCTHGQLSRSCELCELSAEIDCLRSSLQAFIDFQISDYHRSSDAARRYCEIRRAAVKAMGGRS